MTQGDEGLQICVEFTSTRSIRIRLNLYGVNHPYTAESYIDIGAAQCVMKDYILVEIHACGNPSPFQPKQDHTELK